MRKPVSPLEVQSLVRLPLAQDADASSLAPSLRGAREVSWTSKRKQRSLLVERCFQEKSRMKQRLIQPSSVYRSQRNGASQYLNKEKLKDAAED